MSDDRDGRREFFRKAARGLVLGLTGAGTGLLWRGGKIDPSAPRCGTEGKCPTCPTRKECAWLRAGRKDGRDGS